MDQYTNASKEEFNAFIDKHAARLSPSSFPGFPAPTAIWYDIKNPFYAGKKGYLSIVAQHDFDYKTSEPINFRIIKELGE